jgi:uncharacterized membrane protein
MWANLVLLFFLSLIPFSTAWIGMYPNSLAPTIVYGIVLLLCAIAYTILQNTILHYESKDSQLRKAIGIDTKGKLSLGILVAGLLAALILPWISYIFYVAIVLVWIIPDTRLELSQSE